MKLAIVQFGNLSEGFHRLEKGLDETFFAQHYSIRFVKQLASQHPTLAIHCSSASPPESLSHGLASVGMQLYHGRRRDVKTLTCLLDDFAPTHLILNVPLSEIARWARGRGVQLLPLFADSFRLNRPGARSRVRALVRELNHPRVVAVANHGIAAARHLADIGVRPDRVLAWDWPRMDVGLTPTPKAAAPNGCVAVTYVGTVIRDKGVGDLVRAVERVRACRDVMLNIVGSTVRCERGIRRALRAGTWLRVHGKRGRSDVLDLMRAADLVAIPSRHTYPEAMPMTIYESMMCGTPAIVSDHPMFRFTAVHGINCLVAKARSPKSIASAMLNLLASDELYAKVSKNAIATAKHEPQGLLWHELIEQWLHAPDTLKDDCTRFRESCQEPQHLPRLIDESA